MKKYTSQREMYFTIRKIKKRFFIGGIMSVNNKLVLAWLSSEKGIGNRTIAKLIEYFGAAEEIWHNLNGERGNLAYINDFTIDSLISKKNGFEEKLLSRLNKENVKVITMLDDDYPKKLKNIINPPCILYCKGDISCLNNLSIGIVGSRKATDYGKFCADKFARELSALGITIISGLANGIDTIAHKSAIKANGNTIGVIGCGINIIYPQKNRELYMEIENTGGAVITEYPFDMEPISSNFPNRNRIISGLSSGILVVEAQEKSGTLITVSHAAEQGKEVFSIPGNINSIFSVGTNKLIKDGAKLVSNVDDIIEELPEFNNLRDKLLKKEINFNSLNKIEQDIITLISEGEKNFDEISSKINYPINEILCSLTILEMKSMVVQTSGKKFVLAN